MDARYPIAALLLLLLLRPPFVLSQERLEEPLPDFARIEPELVRIRVDAELNGTSARLFLDTGAARSLLFQESAKLLGLKLVELAKKSEASSAVTEDGRVTFRYRTGECTLGIGPWTFEDATFPVFAVPQGLERHAVGILGWPFLRQGVLEIDWDQRRVGFRKDAPAHCTGWAKWKARENASVLIVELPRDDAPALSLVVDTGDPGGVGFGEQPWRRWTHRHGSAKTTLRGSYQPGRGFAVEPRQWARKLILGGVEIEGMPVGFDGNRLVKTWRCDGRIGLLGLSRFNLVIDGPGRTVHVQPRAKFFWKVAYNRLGAVFIPESLESVRLIAHVAPGSPAARAGIRKGDELLAIGDLDVTAWRTDPQVLPLSRFWEQPAGTELVLTLTRGAEPFEITVKLEELFPDAGRYGP
jgi:hypothetical protein